MSEEEIKVSVIMGVYNQLNREELRRSVDSILHQTLRELEFIIYDDGSVPEAAVYIRELEELDPRIRLIGKEENHGLAFSLNACIKETRGKYIARMDADDISRPDRLQIQYDFLESHSEYGWCGTNAELFNENGTWGHRSMPERPEYQDYLKYSPYIHPTVMFRKSVLEQQHGYVVSEETLRCEDYEIFMRLRRVGYRGYNIQQNLLLYQESRDSYQRRRFHYRVSEAKLRYRNFKEMDILFPTGWIYVLRPIAGGLLPNHLIAWYKRRESEYRVETDSAAEKVGLLQKRAAVEPAVNAGGGNLQKTV